MCSGGKLKSSSNWQLQHRVESVAISGKGKATVLCRECLHYLRARNRLQFSNFFSTTLQEKRTHNVHSQGSFPEHDVCSLSHRSLSSVSHPSAQGRTGNGKLPLWGKAFLLQQLVHRSYKLVSSRNRSKFIFGDGGWKLKVSLNE